MYIEVPIDKIQLSPYQPRRHFARGDLEELAQSIATVGIIHPPAVRYLQDLDRYELISGERRLRAAEIAGLKTIAVHVHKSNELQAAQAALIENVQRVDLNPIEVAKALSSLIEQFGWTQEDMAQRIGKKRSTIANYLRLLTLPKLIQDSLVQNEITMGHAKAILSVEGFDKQCELHSRVLRDDLTVRKTEEEALRMGERGIRKKNVPLRSNCFLEDLAVRLQQKFGTKVAFTSQGEQGKLCIDYYNLDDLDRILSIIDMV